MKFPELILCMAIAKAGRCPDTPRSNQQRRELAMRVFPEWLFIVSDSAFPFSIDDIVHWDTVMRKNKNTQVKVKVAERHGVRCFWEGRGKGACCDEVECGHLWQSCKGGPLSIENCVIECRSHNNQRREMSVEEYIKSSLSTSAVGA